MKKQLILGAGILAISLAGAAHAKDKVTKTLDLDGFERIDISGVYDLDVNIGSEFSIELRGESDEMERVKASVKDGVLYLARDDKKNKKRRWGKNNHGIDAKITMPNMKGLEVSGVVDGDIRGIDAEKFSLEVSGVGDIELEGECERLDAEVSGVGDLEAEKLECDTVVVQVSGVGSASVYAREEVDAEVSGMGDIDVYGSPEKVSKSDSMFADVTIH